MNTPDRPRCDRNVCDGSGIAAVQLPRWNRGDVRDLTWVSTVCPCGLAPFVIAERLPEMGDTLRRWLWKDPQRDHRRLLGEDENGEQVADSVYWARAILYNRQLRLASLHGGRVEDAAFIPGAVVEWGRCTAAGVALRALGAA